MFNNNYWNCDVCGKEWHRFELDVAYEEVKNDN